MGSTSLSRRWQGARAKVCFQQKQTPAAPEKTASITAQPQQLINRLTIGAGLAYAVPVGLLERVGFALRLQCLTIHRISKISKLSGRVKQLFFIHNLTSVNVIENSVQMISFPLSCFWKVLEQLLKLVICQGNIVNNGFVLVVNPRHSVVRDVDIPQRD